MVYMNENVRSGADQLYSDNHMAVIEPESADIIQGGYEPIPQENDLNEPDDEIDISNVISYCPLHDDDPHNDTFFSYTKHPQPVISEKDTDENMAGPSELNIHMDDKKVEEVKKIMMNINLPSSCIPKWASDVPEEEWKDFILQKFHLKKSKKYCED